MPDSFTALAILALVGLPGFVYLQLVPRSEDGDRGEVNRNLETIFFGLACAVGGVLLSLLTQEGHWTAMLGREVGVAGGQQPPPVIEHAPFVVGVAFLGSLLTAVLLAGLVGLVRCVGRWLRGIPDTNRRLWMSPDAPLSPWERSGGLLVAAVLGLSVAGWIGSSTDAVPSAISEPAGCAQPIG